MRSYVGKIGLGMMTACMVLPGCSLIGLGRSASAHGAGVSAKGAPASSGATTPFRLQLPPRSTSTTSTAPPQTLPTSPNSIGDVFSQCCERYNYPGQLAVIERDLAQTAAGRQSTGDVEIELARLGEDAGTEYASASGASSTVPATVQNVSDLVAYVKDLGALVGSAQTAHSACATFTSGCSAAVDTVATDVSNVVIAAAVLTNDVQGAGG